MRAPGMEPRHAGPLFLLLLSIASLVSSPAHAAGPLLVATDGSPVTWDASTAVLYRTDRGGLGLLPDSTATAKAETLFTVWDAVPTATITFQRDGSLPEDVDVTNFGPYLGPFGGSTAPLGMSAIVFDADGSIFDLLYGIGSGVLGFAACTWCAAGTDTLLCWDALPPGTRIIEGLSFLNGKFIDGINEPSQGNMEIPLEMFEAAFIHEFGHFAGIDHTQIHGLRLPFESDQSGWSEPIETMFPYLRSAGQTTLERDDLVSISALYPTEEWSATTGTIRGLVLSQDGLPFSGAMVVARNTADESDAVASCAGADMVHTGAFTLPGLTPGASYRIDVGPIDYYFQGGSGIGYFSPPIIVSAPPESYNGASESGDPAVDDPAAYTPVSVEAGGTTSGIDITLNQQAFRPVIAGFRGEAVRNIATGDFDGDGTNDLVTTRPAHNEDPNDRVEFHHGRGQGVFDEPVEVDVIEGAEFVTSGQFNSGVDRFLDFAVGTELSGQIRVRVYFGDGRGGFAARTTVFESADPHASGLRAADLDGDAFTDLFLLVTGTDDSAVTHALLGSASGAFTDVPTLFDAGAALPSVFTVGNFSGGAADDVLGLRPGGNYVTTELKLLTNNGSGGFTSNLVALGGITDNLLTAQIASGDFNGDGRADAVVVDAQPSGGPSNNTRCYLDLLLNDGSGNFSLSDRIWVPDRQQSGLAVTDLNGDGRLDLASTGNSGAFRPGSRLTVAFGDGAGHLEDQGTVWGVGEMPFRVVAADADGDGRSDLLVTDGTVPTFPSDWNAGSVVLNRLVLPSLGAFGLLDPANGESLATDQPTARWTAAAGAGPADTVGYTIFWADNAEFIGARSAAVGADTTYTFGFGDLDVQTTYYWKVRASGTSGSLRWADPAAGWSFFVVEGTTPCRINPVIVEEVEGIRISWPVPADYAAASFRVFRRVAEAGPAADWECIAPEVRGDAEACVLDTGAEPGVLYEYEIEAFGPSGSAGRFGPVSGARPFPSKLSLRISPNPSTGSMRLDLTLPRSGEAVVRVFDVQGREVARRSWSAAAGPHGYTWEPRDRAGRILPSGIYSVRLETPTGRAAARWVRLR